MIETDDPHATKSEAPGGAGRDPTPANGASKSSASASNGFISSGSVSSASASSASVSNQGTANAATSKLAVPDAPASIARTFGATLAAERERQGLSINEIAARLRLHPKQIAALEQEQLQQLPELAFVRGFIRNYAKELRLAPEVLLAQVNASILPGRGAALATGGSVGGGSVILRTATAERLSRGLIISGIVGGLVVLGVVGWIAKPQRALAPTVAPAPAKIEASPVAVPAPLVTSVDAVPLPSAPQQATAAPLGNAGATIPPQPPKTTTVPAAAVNGPASTAAAAPSTRAEVTAPTANPTTASSANAPAAIGSGKNTAASGASVAPDAPVTGSSAAAVGTMRLVFGDKPSWLEVTQGDGRLLFSGINDPGSQRMLIGVPPLRLVIGNASTVALDYRGRRIDLKPVTSLDDVARITLPPGMP